MIERFAEASPRRWARIAGAFYLLTFVTGGLSAAFVGGRYGLAGAAVNLIASACYVAVVALFYYMFKPVSTSLSLLALLCGLSGCAVGALDVFHLSPVPVNSLVFFGFYCLVIGYLIFRSTFLPRILGVLMMLAGLGWLTFLSPSLASHLSPYNFFPGLLGEGSLTVWLLAIGLNVPRWRQQAGAAATDTGATVTDRREHPIGGGTELPDHRVESSQRMYARLAGAMYLVVLVFDVSGAVITSAIQGSGTFLDVARSIVAWETLYRIGLLCSLVGSLAVVVLAVSLYATLKPVDRNLTTMALLFRLAESAIGAMGIVTAFSILQIRLAATQGDVFDANQLGALANLSPAAATEISAIFFSAGSAMFFYVFLKSGYIPRILSAWGIFASLVYMAVWFIDLALPNRPGLVVILGSLPILIAEVGTAVWLLTAGIRDSTSLGAPVASTPMHASALEGGQ